ncbi:MAG: alpha/beta fold hydrolase [Chloroflexota bacterium]
MSSILTGAEPFFFPGGRTGCLLIHGFTGTPREMRLLGEHLAREGHTVLGVRLFAHATQLEDMLRARWPDWLASAEDGYHLLRSQTDRVVAMGLSMGGVLSLLLAARLPLAGVAAMSTPYDPPDPRMRLRPLVPVLSLVWRFGKKGPPDWHDAQAAVGHLEYPLAPVRGAAELYDLLLEMRRVLPSIRCPALIIHSRGDLAVHPSHAEAILARLGSTQKELLWVENSGHVVTCDAERERLFAATAAFVRRLEAPSA